MNTECWRLPQIVFGLDPSHQKVVSIADASQILRIAAASEYASAAAWEFITSYWDLLVQGWGPDA